MFVCPTLRKCTANNGKPNAFVYEAMTCSLFRGMDGLSEYYETKSVSTSGT